MHYPDGSQYTQVYTGPAGTASPMWSRTTSDALGRTILSERPGFGGTTLVTSNAFDAAGHLRESVLICGQNLLSRTLYTYDSLGAQTLTAQDTDLDNILDLAGPDRVTSNAMEYVQIGSDWWQEQRSYIFPDNSANPKLVGTQRSRLTGLGSSSALGLLAAESLSLDLLGNETASRTYVNSAAKRVTQLTDTPDSSRDALQLSINGLSTLGVSATGVTNTMAYDAIGRPISVTDGRGNAAVTHYNALDQVDYQVDAVGSTNSFTYDSLTGRRTAVTDPLGQSTYTAYDTEGRVIATWGATYPVAYEYDSFGRMVSLATYRGTGAITNYASFQFPVSSFDKTRWFYDQSTGLLTNKLYADGKGPSYTYTPDGKLARRTWARGVTTDYEYAACCGSLLSITYSDGTPGVTNSYDRLGRVATLTDGTGTRTFAYNDHLQLAAETNALGVLSYAYDALGRSSGLTAGPDYAVGYGYDTLGRFSSVTSGLSVASYSYLPGSDLLSGWTVGSLTVSRTFEANRNLLTQVRTLAGTNGVSLFDYQNDALGRRTARLDQNGFLPAVTNLFDYNLRSELISAQMGTNAYGYVFDPIGNRQSSTNNGESFRYAANALNQYTNISDGVSVQPSYDADGSAPSEARRFLRGESPCRVRISHPLVPSVGTVEEESHPNDIV